VSFALTMEPPAAATVLDASVFLGVCEDICIPVKADFRIDTAAQASMADDEQTVDEAFADLPSAPHDGFRVVEARISDDALEVRAETPAGSTPDLFLASSAGPVFGTPVAEAANGGALFRVPLLAALDGEANELRYTLVAGEDAVAGTIEAAGP
jgi:DsbC/DsbD-like thiol-disulfide interchange protein